MILYPDYYCNKITDISVELLKSKNIKGLILDIDNTLIDFDLNILQGAKDWVNNIKANGIKCIILSNTNKIDKVKKVAENLDLPYIYFAKKPLKGGFRKAKIALGLENEYVAAIGDQIFTDVLGANRCNMFSILVNPISKKDLWMTRLKRPLEEIVVKSYVKSQKKKEGKKDELY